VEEKRKFEFGFEGNVMEWLAKSKQANFYASISSIPTWKLSPRIWDWWILLEVALEGECSSHIICLLRFEGSTCGLMYLGGTKEVQTKGSHLSGEYLFALFDYAPLHPSGNLS